MIPSHLHYVSIIYDSFVKFHKYLLVMCYYYFEYHLSKKKKFEVLLSNLSLHLDEPYITLIIYHHIVINMYMKFFDVHTKNSGLL